MGVARLYFAFFLLVWTVYAHRHTHTNTNPTCSSLLLRSGLEWISRLKWSLNDLICYILIAGVAKIWRKYTNIKNHLSNIINTKIIDRPRAKHTHRRIMFWSTFVQRNTGPCRQQPSNSFLSPPTITTTTTNCQGRNNDYREAEDESSCDACLYTGIATCTGLSGYMFKMALLDLPEEGTKQFTNQVRNQKRFLLLFGASWAVAGIYRLYLGWGSCSCSCRQVSQLQSRSTRHVLEPESNV